MAGDKVEFQVVCIRDLTPGWDTCSGCYAQADCQNPFGGDLSPRERKLTRQPVRQPDEHDELSPFRYPRYP